MAQADNITIDNGNGLAVRANINDVLAAALSGSSGATPPPDPIGGQPWIMFTEAEVGLKIRSMDNTAWENWLLFGLTEPPGPFQNEATGYRVGSIVSTSTTTYRHTGAGNWVELGTGTGGGGTSSGGPPVFDLGPMYVGADTLDTGSVVDLGSMYYQEAA